MSKLQAILFVGAILFVSSSKGHFRFLGSSQKTNDGMGGNSDSLYFLSVNSAEWHVAGSDCKGFLGDNATLAYLESPEEFEHLEQLLSKTDATVGTFWVGGEYNIDKDAFVWGNGVEMGEWVPWDAGHPDSLHPVTKVLGYHVGGLRLRTQLQTVQARYLCEVNYTSSDSVDEPKQCPVSNDLIIIVDASGSISPQHFMIALEFTEQLTVTWLATEDTRVSVIIFSDITKKLFGLEDSQNLEVAEIMQLIYTAPHFQSITNTHKALEEALSEFKSSNRTGANKFPQNVVLLTDGVSTYPTNTLASAAKLLDAGIRVVSVGIGDDIDSKELLAVTGGNSERVFTSDNFDSLLSLLRPVSEQICKKDGH